jgi:PDZ domain-containing secreted protein
MSSSPFGINAKKSSLGNSLKAKEVIPKEPVTLIADKKYQIITALIPYNSKQAATIRAYMHANITIDGQRVFIFRVANGWSTVALDATESNPKLTGEPIMVLKLAYTKFSECPAVSTVTIKWAGSDEILTYEDIDQMEAKFDPLPDPQPDADPVTNKGDADYLMDKLNEVDKKVDDKILQLGNKIDEVTGQMMAEIGDKMRSLHGQMDLLISSIRSDSVTPDSLVLTPATGHSKKQRVRKGGGEASGSLDLN